MSASPPRIVFAEMPEAAGRDISVELRHLPDGARVERFVFEGDVPALVAACRDADAVLTDYVRFDDAVLAQLGRCRLISIAATGFDCVDLAAAAARGIAVCCVAEYCTEEVADHTLALLLAMTRRLREYDRQVQVEHDWRWDRQQGLRRLSGQTLGLIGFGRIGQAVCRRARAFGMQVLACDPLADPAVFAPAGARPVELDALLAGADVISLHCNLDAGSRGLMNAAAFARMQRRPLLINVARGGLVVEPDLVRALEAGQVRAAALDVLQEDSPDLARHPLAGRDDVLLTPHVAFLSDAALEELRRISAANLRHALHGEHAAVTRYVVEPARKP